MSGFLAHVPLTPLPQLAALQYWSAPQDLSPTLQPPGPASAVPVSPVVTSVTFGLVSPETLESAVPESALVALSAALWLSEVVDVSAAEVVSEAAPVSPVLVTSGAVVSAAWLSAPGPPASGVAASSPSVTFPR